MLVNDVGFIIQVDVSDLEMFFMTEDVKKEERTRV